MLGGAVLVFEGHHFLSCRNHSCVALDVQDSGSKSREPALAMAIGYRYSKLAPLPSVCRPRFLPLYLNVITVVRKDIHEEEMDEFDHRKYIVAVLTRKDPNRIHTRKDFFMTSYFPAVLTIGWRMGCWFVEAFKGPMNPTLPALPAWTGKLSCERLGE